MIKSKTPLKSGAAFFTTWCGFIGTTEEDLKKHDKYCGLCSFHVAK